jgi:FkbM family methyltransferase
MYDRRSYYVKGAMRILQWRLISAVGRGAVHRLPGLPFRMYLEPRFRSVGSLSLYAIGARYEPGLALIPNLLRPGDVMFDCGANQGAYALYAAHAVGPSGHVVAVEPQPYAVACLRKSLSANGFGNVEVVEAAVSDQRGVMPFYFNTNAVAASLVNDGVAEAHDVEVWSIDDLMASRGLDRADLLKLDVEGAEAAVLRGARLALARHHPLVIFEVWDPANATSREAWAILEAAGYQMFDMVGGRRIEHVDAPVRSHGLLAVARERMDRLEGLEVVGAQAAPPSRRPVGAARPGSQDALAAGYEVFVVADAACSRRDADHAVALERLRAEGVVVLPTESVLYEAAEVAATDEFRALLRIVKD